MTARDLLYHELENEVRATVRKLLDQEFPAESLMACVEDSAPLAMDLWDKLDAIGMTNLLVPEEVGGSGPAIRECAVVVEELGRALAPVPFLGSAILAASLLVALDDGNAQKTLAEMVDAQRRATVAVPLSRSLDAGFPETVTSAAGVLTGAVTSVVDLDGADHVIVPAFEGHEPQLHLVAIEDDGVSTEPVVSFDLTRPLADLSLSRAQGTCIARGDEAVSSFERALMTGATLLASEQIGVAQWCLDATLEHLHGRFQFGRPIGSFQALKHRVADLWVTLITGRAVARAAVDDLHRASDEARLSCALAQAYCSDAAVALAEAAMQLHAGIGFTWEHPLHLYLARAKSSQLAFGTPEAHRRTIARLVDLAAPSGERS